MIFGTTGNATSEGYQWVMTNVLPKEAGLAVNAVIYRYTTEKASQDPMLVSIQNENARGSGYIFRETDDWSGLSGNTIDKTIPVPNIDISYWGAGSIAVEGIGSVTDASVFYSYQYEPKEELYVQKPPETTEAYREDYIQKEMDRRAVVKSAEEDDWEEYLRWRREKEAEESLLRLLGFVDVSPLSEESRILHERLKLTNYLPQSYFSNMAGGNYPETLKLDGGTLPDSVSGRRVGLAQQLKHDKMVQLQFEPES